MVKWAKILGYNSVHFLLFKNTVANLVQQTGAISVD